MDQVYEDQRGFDDDTDEDHFINSVYFRNGFSLAGGEERVPQQAG